MGKDEKSDNSPGMSVRTGAFELTPRGARRYDWRDPYHLALAMSWPRFILVFVTADLAINILFATAYLAQPGTITNAHPGSLSDAFFFSLETLATVGYGVMAPATIYGHVVASIEILCGMAFMAIMTGLVFVRFSRPRARIVYAGQSVVGEFNGKPHFDDPHCQWPRTSADRCDGAARRSRQRMDGGRPFLRRIIDLPLVRSRCRSLR